RARGPGRAPATPPRGPRRRGGPSRGPRTGSAGGSARAWLRSRARSKRSTGTRARATSSTSPGTCRGRRGSRPRAARRARRGRPRRARERRPAGRPRPRAARRRALLDFPGIARAEQLAEVAVALARDLRADLLVDAGLVDGRGGGTQHAQRSGEAGRRVHAREQERVAGVGMALVVHDQVLLGGAVAERHHLQLEPVHAQALVLVLAEDERLAVLHRDRVVVAHLALGQG